MTILLIGSVLFGAVLGRFFKFLILVPTCAFVLGAVLVESTYVEHGLLRQVLEFAVLITSLQIGYVLGLISSFATRKAAPGPGNAYSGDGGTRRPSGSNDPSARVLGMKFDGLMQASPIGR